MYLNLFIFFIIGVLFGYICNNIGYRLPIKESFFNKSKCDKCNHELSIKEKIPIISYIIQGGKCRYCHQKISPIYIIFELLTGFLFSLTYITFFNYNNPGLVIFISLIFISTLLIVMVSDIKYMLIQKLISLITKFALGTCLFFRNCSCGD